jgi:hypothetical protein
VLQRAEAHATTDWVPMTGTPLGDLISHLPLQFFTCHPSVATPAAHHIDVRCYRSTVPELHTFLIP